MRLRSATGRYLSKRQVAAYLGISRKQERSLSKVIRDYTTPAIVRERRRVQSQVYRARMREERRKSLTPEKRLRELIAQRQKEERQRVAAIISTKELRGSIEKKRDDVPTGKVIVVSRGMVHHRERREANWQWDGCYFFTRLQSRETYLQEIARVLPTLTQAAGKYIADLDARWQINPRGDPQPISVRWRLWIREPVTNQRRDLWESSRAGRMTGRGVTEVMLDELQAHDFTGMIAEHYWQDGYLVEGIALYAYTEPVDDDYFPVSLLAAYDRKHPLAPKVKGKRKRSVHSELKDSRAELKAARAEIDALKREREAGED